MTREYTANGISKNECGLVNQGWLISTRLIQYSMGPIDGEHYRTSFIISCLSFFFTTKRRIPKSRYRREKNRQVNWLSDVCWGCGPCDHSSRAASSHLLHERTGRLQTKEASNVPKSLPMISCCALNTLPLGCIYPPYDGEPSHQDHQ